MLIPFNKVVKEYLAHVKIHGILHLGAHDCEELNAYEACGIRRENILWIDAIEEKVQQAKNNGIPNVYQAVISDREEECILHITNNYQSTSILELNTHKHEHPDIYVTERRSVRAKTLTGFFMETGLDPKNYNLWSLDIQGAELSALRGADEILENVDAIYTEVNVQHVYKDCPLINDLDRYLSTKGFVRVCEVILSYGWGDALYIKKHLGSRPLLNFIKRF